MAEIAIARDGCQYVTLGIDGEVFAVEVEMVREILDMRPVSRVPNAPSFMMGMIDVRGHTVPVICLRSKLGLPAVPPTEHTRIVVLEIPLGDHTRTMGLIADQVFEVTPLPEGGMETAPDIGTRWSSEYIQAIGRRNGAFVIVFDLTHLFSSDEKILLGGEG
ncbi:MAG TPA: chemotaxis protein CheW [Candidatus Sulfotelmatobacter sp.]|jgi:purine-binding chemotaxis protein CheW|nr:chemotaxis protein CheW [Candidatus Sulfotelmatobacter sp.]